MMSRQLGERVQELFQKRRQPTGDSSLNIVSVVENTTTTSILFIYRLLRAILSLFLPTKANLIRIYATDFRAAISPITLFSILYMVYFVVIQYFTFYRRFYEETQTGTDSISKVIASSFSLESFLQPLLIVISLLIIINTVSRIAMPATIASQRFLVFSQLSASSVCLLLFMAWLTIHLPVKPDSPDQPPNITVEVLFLGGFLAVVSGLLYFPLYIRVLAGSALLRRRFQMRPPLSFVLVAILVAIGFCAVIWFLRVVVIASLQAALVQPPVIIGLILTALSASGALYRYSGRISMNIALLAAKRIVFIGCLACFSAMLNSVLLITPAYLSEHEIAFTNLFPEIEGAPEIHCSAVATKQGIFVFVANTVNRSIVVWPQSVTVRTSATGQNPFMGRDISSGLNIFARNTKVVDRSFPILVGVGDTIVVQTTLEGANTTYTIDQVFLGLETNFENRKFSSSESRCQAQVIRRSYG